MENRIGNSHGAEIPKKSRSLDLKSLYESKGPKEVQNKNLKRKAGVEDVGTEKRRERKKSRKALSLSSFKNINNNGSKSLEEVYSGSLSSGSHDSKNSESGLNQGVNDSSGFSSISFTLEDGVVKIPRRKRGLVRRRKVVSASQVSKLERQSSGRTGSVEHVDKLTGEETYKRGESLKVRRKKCFDDFKENGNGESNSGRHLDEDFHVGRSVLNNGDSSLKKLHAGHSVETNGDSSLKNSQRKRNRKRKDLVPDNKSVAKEAGPSVDASVKINGDLQDDDEENLEENAARMLSSRFDPSCTGFASNSKASALPSTNGLSFLSPSDREFITSGSNYVSESESVSADAAGRVLRPRKQHGEKGNSRKRRHYYEIYSGDLDAYWVLNRRIKVFWPLDQSWYYGLVNDYDEERMLHHVKYDDRDEEWINLQNERFKLLLLPGEVPGKTRRQRFVTKEKSFDQRKGKSKPREEKNQNLTPENDRCVGNYMDSEPIISWLARSTNRTKSSPFCALKKQKTSGQFPIPVPLLSEEAADRHGCSDGGSLNGDKSRLSRDFALPDSLAATGISEESAMESPTCPKDSKFPIVYYRRRFRKTSNVLCLAFEDGHDLYGVPESDSSHAHVAVTSGAMEEHGITSGRLDPDEVLKRLDPIEALEMLNTVEALWLTDNTGLSKLNIPLIGSRKLVIELSFPVPSFLNYSSGTQNIWLFHSVLLLQYGTLMNMWPRVQLEMIFVDNMVGLRCLLFEGCLKQAVAFVFLVLNVFHQPNGQGKYADLHFPLTSIRFKFSCVQAFGKQLVFAFYNFSEVKNSKWRYLDYKLKSHCSLTWQLHLSECTYDNIQALQNGTNQLLSSSVCLDTSSIKGLQKKSRQYISLMAVSGESTYVNCLQAYYNSDKNHRYFPPFALSFAAAPTFFLGLHLKLLMERSLTHITFRGPESTENPENSGSSLSDYCSNMEDCNKGSERSTVGQNSRASLRDTDCDVLLSCATPELRTVGTSACGFGDWMKSSPKYQNGDVTVGISASSKDPGNLGSDAMVPLQKWQHHSERCHLSPILSVNIDKSDTCSHSLPNGISVEIPSFNQFDKNVDKELDDAQQSMDLFWNTNGGIIPSPNPTARRSAWHRNRSSSSSFGYHAHGWSDMRSDFLQNNFCSGPKKPRTQVSYALPFGAFDSSSKNKSHQQKGLPHKRIRMANEKKLSDVSRSSERNFESLSCDANVLITLGDKGWRECGAQVALELFDHNEWKLAVKLSGTTKYSYKAHQFLQPGSTNRYTHAMMWKGGKDWILEFPDRSQWALFKEMHEECYNRNIRAASVKNIPIPGVCLIEENDDNGTEVSFIRSSSKYIRQLETDVEMALDPTRVLYDMDSDDELWMLRNRSSSEVDNGSLLDISEEMFERTVDMFEKAAYTQQRDQFTPDEIEELMVGVGPTEAIKTIHEYWRLKRQRRGMSLIRHLQPPLWERYQQQVREWELALTKGNTAASNVFHEKVSPIEKAPMFAFCLKPRGLEVPNKGSKQRSQRKFLLAGQSNTFSGDHDGFHGYGRRTNGFASGDEKFLYTGVNYDSLDDSPLPQISPRVFSPWDAGGMGYFSMSGDRYDRNHLHKLHRSKSKKIGMFTSPRNSQMLLSYSQRMFDKRNGVNRWNSGFSDWSSQQHYHLDGSMRHGPEQWDGSDVDEFRLRDASGAARHAFNMAKLKREKARRLLYRADLAIHKAVVALMTAEAIKASSENLNGDG